MFETTDSDSLMDDFQPVVALFDDANCTPLKRVDLPSDAIGATMFSSLESAFESLELTCAFLEWLLFVDICWLLYTG